MLASFSIRQVTTQDFTTFRSLRLEALLKEPHLFGATHEQESRISDDEWRERIENPKSAFFILLSDGTPVGVTGILTNKENEDQAILIASYIKQDFRGLRGSTFLYEARLAWARRKGFKEVVVSHRGSNEASRRANQKHGFKYTHKESHLWNDGQVEDNVFYVLKL